MFTIHSIFFYFEYIYNIYYIYYVYIVWSLFFHFNIFDAGPPSILLLISINILLVLLVSDIVFELNPTNHKTITFG